nr:fibrobacter succinogenes major paralogous domain-containing protein [uncultured Draconibacterium sp.]
MKKFLFFLAIVLLAFSCSKDETETPEQDFSGDSGTFTDTRDNHTYKWVRIGNQIWMAENLKATNYQNGDAIPDITDNVAWDELSSGAYCNFSNNENNVNKYGLLYNWFAVNDNRNIAPKGWHVASDEEWTELINYVSNNLGNSCGVTSALAAKSNWETSYTYNDCFPGMDYNTNNSSGFTALPGGCRDLEGTFDDEEDAFWWSSTEQTAVHAYCRYIWAHWDEVERAGFSKNYGLYVRCIKD